MKRTLPKALVTAGLLYLGLATIVLAFDGPESLDINLQASSPQLATTNKDRKMVPGFSHAEHATKFLLNNSNHARRTYDDKFTCAACHPGVKSARDIRSGSGKQAQIDAVNQAGGVKKYMHGLCLTCHKSMKKAKVTTGPTTCKGCHAAR